MTVVAFSRSGTRQRAKNVPPSSLPFPELGFIPLGHSTYWTASAQAMTTFPAFSRTESGPITGGSLKYVLCIGMYFVTDPMVKWLEKNGKKNVMAKQLVSFFLLTILAHKSQICVLWADHLDPKSDLTDLRLIVLHAQLFYTAFLQKKNHVQRWTCKQNFLSYFFGLSTNNQPEMNPGAGYWY